MAYEAEQFFHAAARPLNEGTIAKDDPPLLIERVQRRSR
jgi:hypothetical protein